jgi:glycine/D-amino acid oxidase-like deaminating enzyme
MTEADVIVVGGGVVGSAIGFGLAKAGQRVLVLDGEDGEFRAARANFGLVWVQGKGPDKRPYQAITRDSSDLWPGFLDEVMTASGVKVDYERKGGLIFCLSDAEFEKRRSINLRLHNHTASEGNDCEMLERPRLEAMLPGVKLGPDVVGASYCWRDGHSNPLQLLAALHTAIKKLNGTVLSRRHVTHIKPGTGHFTVSTENETFVAARVVIAAGLGSGDAGKDVDLAVPVLAQRGQILVTERMAPLLPFPASGLRQTAEGTFMVGATQEDVGFNIDATAAAATTLAGRATRIIPALADARLVRQWAGLRVLSPDKYPIYAESPTFPGAFVAICHSGVTLAAFHAKRFADAVISGHFSPAFDAFHHRRFDVQKSI